MESTAPKILLVDDDDLSRRMMALLLSEKGYNFSTASNGVEAIEAVKSKSFDIVLMDLQMPVMDGFEATSNIRAWEAGTLHTPIIALTAMLMGDEIQRCLSVGMDDCISKPFNTETLFQVIESFVNQPKRQLLRNDFQLSTNHDEQEMLDIKEALPRFSRDMEFYRDTLNEFVEDLPERMSNFRKTFVSGDFTALSHKAHNLKGISASMGAKRLSHLAHVLDQSCQDGDSLRIGQALEEIEKHAQVFQEEAFDILSGFTGQLER